MCNSVTGTVSSCKVSLDKNNITIYRETIDCDFSMYSECTEDWREVFRYKMIDGEWKKVNSAGNPKK